MKKTFLTAAFAALALGAAQAVMVDWEWDNYSQSAPTEGDQWIVRSDNANTFQFTVPTTGGIASGTEISVTELVFGTHSTEEALVGTVTITDSEGDTVGTVSGFTDTGSQLYTATGGTNPTPNGQSATVAGITLVAGETYTFSLSEGSCFALIETDVTAATALTGQWVVAMGIQGTYNDGTVPEPTALALLALGVAGVALRRRAA